jgi:myo-inositol-1(or 4)-monophosphatase
VVVDPVRRRTWRGTRGQGATVEGERLRASDVRTLDEALFATGFPYDRRQRAAFYLKLVQRVLERTQGVRRAGAAALDLAMLAEGHVDAYWEFGLRPWDTMAGFVLVTEAGGRVSPIPGRTLTDPVCPIATNAWLHDEVVALIGDALKEGS